MPAAIDILLLLPDVATIGHAKLQDYCDEWLQRPIARAYGITQLLVGLDLMLAVNIDAKTAKYVGERVYLPIDELVAYIIDQQFPDSTQRQRLQAQLRDIRQRWSEQGSQNVVTADRVGTLYLKCKNPTCDVWMETSQKASEGQVIKCPPFEAVCPACGYTDIYDGSDLQWMAAKQ